MYGNGKVGGAGHVPPGWDDWQGLIGNSVYHDYDLSNNGIAEPHGRAAADYLTDLVRDRAAAFLETAPAPWFAVLSVPASHQPFEPPPRHYGRYDDLPYPKPGAYNVSRPDAHRLIRTKTPLTSKDASHIEQTYRRRLECLLSVDEMMNATLARVAARGEAATTYTFVTSDHGWHLGQFNARFDKRLLYEFDIRVPFTLAGPGIPQNVEVFAAGTNVDVAPTLYEIVNGEAPPADAFDGRSLMPAARAGTTVPDDWRTDLLIEYWGEGDDAETRFRTPLLVRSGLFLGAALVALIAAAVYACAARRRRYWRAPTAEAAGDVGLSPTLGGGVGAPPDVEDAEIAGGGGELVPAAPAPILRRRRTADVLVALAAVAGAACGAVGARDAARLAGRPTRATAADRAAAGVGAFIKPWTVGSAVPGVPKKLGAGYRQDEWDNTYRCARTLAAGSESIYCEFSCFNSRHGSTACAAGTPEATGEYYDLEADPDQLVNAVGDLDRAALAAKRARLAELVACRGGAACAGL